MTKRSRNVSADDVLSRETKAAIGAAAKQEFEETHFPVPFPAMVAADRLVRDLQDLLARGDGWLRIGCDLDGKVCYIKYKLTSVSWPNHYVFISGPVYDIALHVSAVVRKLELVDAGNLRPTPDKPFNHM
jgi:hypothetical protein